MRLSHPSFEKFLLVLAVGGPSSRVVRGKAVHMRPALTHNKNTTQAHKTKTRRSETRGDHFQAFRQRWNLAMQHLTHLIPSIYFLHVYFITVVDDPDASEKHKSKPERQHGPPSEFKKLDVHARA